jgi:hypothetical protein
MLADRDRQSWPSTTKLEATGSVGASVLHSFSEYKFELEDNYFEVRELSPQDNKEMPRKGFECSIAILNSPKTLRALDHAFIGIHTISADSIAID